MLTFRHFGSNPIRESGDLQDQVTRLSHVVQDWGNRSDERLSNLESSVSSIQGSLRELKEKCKLLETKLKLQELREQRLELLAVALERFFDENNVPGAESEGERQVPLRRSERKRNLDKLLATEKCRPELDFPERMKTPVKSPLLATPVVPTNTHGNVPVLDISLEDVLLETRESGVEQICGISQSNSVITMNQPDDIAVHAESNALVEQTCKEVFNFNKEGDKGAKCVRESPIVEGPSNSVTTVLKKKRLKRQSSVNDLVDHINQNRSDQSGNRNSEAVESPQKSKDVAGIIFKCSFCTKSFQSKQTNLEHELTHSNGRLNCSHCDFETDYRRCLNKHLKRLHKNVSVKSSLSGSSSIKNTPTGCKRKNSKKVLKIKLLQKPTTSPKSIEADRQHVPSSSVLMNNCKISENSQKASPEIKSALSEAPITETPERNIRGLKDQSEPPPKKKKKIANTSSRSSSLPQEACAPEIRDSSSNKRKSSRKDKRLNESCSSSLSFSSPNVQQSPQLLEQKKQKIANTSSKSSSLPQEACAPEIRDSSSNKIKSNRKDKRLNESCSSSLSFSSPNVQQSPQLLKQKIANTSSRSSSLPQEACAPEIRNSSSNKRKSSRKDKRLNESCSSSLSFSSPNVQQSPQLLEQKKQKIANTSSKSSSLPQEACAPEIRNSSSNKRKSSRKDKRLNESCSSSLSFSSPNVQQSPQLLEPSTLPLYVEHAEVHSCPFCSKTCRSISRLEKHLQRKH